MADDNFNFPTIGNAVLRDSPYIYATWIAKLMSGEYQCAWAMWFKAHYTHDKIALGGNFDGWQANHNDLLQHRRESLVNEGYRVFVEAQNRFTLHGKDTRVSIGGKIDIIAIKPERVVIEDCKTGLPKNSDLMQILIYMLLGPLALANCRKAPIHGRLVYTEKVVEIPLARLSDPFKAQFRRVVAEVGGDTAPPRTPSVQECGWCNIGSDYCDDRIESHQDETIDHDAF